MAGARNAPITAASLRRAFARDFAHRAKTLHRLASKHALTTDDVHDLRVTTRRLRASIAVLRRARVDAKTSEARKRLRALGRALGECRMIDVAIADATHYRVSTAALEVRRNRAYAGLRRALAASRVKALAKMLGRIERKIATAKFDGLDHRLTRLEERACRRLATPPRSRRARHALRIEMKKVRYLIEAFGRESPAMRRLQDALGREHDLIVLQQMVSNIPHAGRDERAARVQADGARKAALTSAIRHLRVIRAGLRRASTH